MRERENVNMRETSGLNLVHYILVKLETRNGVEHHANSVFSSSLPLTGLLFSFSSLTPSEYFLSPSLMPSEYLLSSSFTFSEYFFSSSLTFFAYDTQAWVPLLRRLSTFWTNSSSVASLLHLPFISSSPLSQISPPSNYFEWFILYLIPSLTSRRCPCPLCSLMTLSLHVMCTQQYSLTPPLSHPIHQLIFSAPRTSLTC